MNINLRQSSRVGNKQICCYIKRFFHLHVIQYARKNNLTHQQALANIINSYCKDVNGKTPLPHYEAFTPKNRRKKGKALIRKNATAKYRKTRIAISGWYKKEYVNELIEIAHSYNTSLQKFCEKAICEKAKIMSESEN